MFLGMSPLVKKRCDRDISNLDAVARGRGSLVWLEAYPDGSCIIDLRVG